MLQLQGAPRGYARGLGAEGAEGADVDGGGCCGSAGRLKQPEVITYREAQFRNGRESEASQIDLPRLRIAYNHPVVTDGRVLSS